MDKNKLTGEFEIEARWLIDDSKKIQYGVLRYSQSSIVVELPDSDLDFDKKFTKLIGENQKDIISLFNVRVISESNKHLTKTKLLAEYMFIDKNPINSVRNFETNSIYWSTDKLALLLNASVWKSLSKGKGVEYSEIPMKEYKIQSLGATLSIGYSYVTSSQLTPEGLVDTFKTIPYFNIKYSKAKNIIEIKEDVRRICNLICILSGAPQVISTFKYSSTGYDVLGNEIPVNSQFYFNQENPSRKNFQKHHSAYNFEKISENFDIILSNFFENYDGLLPIVQHLRILYSYKNLLESSYIDSITSLEAFHTEYYGADKKITTFTEDIISKLKEKTKKDYKNKNGKEETEKELLLTYINNVKKFTLRERLIELFDETPVKLKGKFKHSKTDFLNTEDRMEFIRKSVKARNNFAHGNSGKIFTFDEMLSATYILSMVSESLLMNKIGMSEEVIVEGVFGTKIYQSFLDSTYDFETPTF